MSMQFSRWCLGAMTLFVALVGCKPGTPDTSAPDDAVSSGAPASAGGSLDTEAQAREFGASFINEQMAGKEFTDEAGNPVSPPKVDADTWRLAEKNGDRWTLKRGPPGNWYFNAEFNVDGSNATYEAVYFAE